LLQNRILDFIFRFSQSLGIVLEFTAGEKPTPF